VMLHMKPRLKRWLGRRGIFFTAASQFARYEFPRLRVRIDGEEHSATFAVVCRARHYAGDWIIAPDARPHGENLDVLLFDHRSHWKLYRLFKEMEAGQAGHLQNGLARVVRGRGAEILSAEDYPVEVEIDGDCILETPVKCRVGEEMVRILVPRESGLKIAD